MSTQKTKKVLTGLLFIILSSSLFSCSFFEKKDVNVIGLKKFLQELKSLGYDKEKLYQKYMLIPAEGEPDRSDEAKKYYKDSLFYEMHIALQESIAINVLPLKRAKKELGNSIVEYDYYYEGQKNNIYFIWISSKKMKFAHVQYVLVVDGKIVSLYGYAQDGKLFWWS